MFAMLAIAAGLLGQTAPKTIMGTVSAFRPENAEIEIKPESAAPVSVKVSTATPIRRVAPGQTDISRADVMAVTDLAVGDRVLVTLGPDGSEARRIIVVAANDIQNRLSADRQDWQKRGISGVVSAITGDVMTVDVRSIGGLAKYAVTTTPKTTFMRYASDSAKFSDARKSALAEVSVGDQIRARGEKSSDPPKMTAADVVFGTFLSKAGTITAVNTEAHEVTIRDLTNKNKPIVIRFTADSQVKRMPPLNQVKPTRPGADLASILEMLPAEKLEELKSGDVVVVSALQGAAPDRITAIDFVSNAEDLVKLVASPTGPPPSLAGLAGSMGAVGP
jgi:hypothetical protein